MCTNIVYTTYTMLKNITLSAQEESIKALRAAAKKRGTTANAMFREWASKFEESETQSRESELDELWDRLRKSGVNAGRKFTREEMNER